MEKICKSSKSSLKKAFLLCLLVLTSLTSLGEVVKYKEGFLGMNAEFCFTIETRNDSAFILVTVISKDVQIRQDAKMLIKIIGGDIIKLDGKRQEHGLLTTVRGSAANGYGATSTDLYYYSAAEFPISKDEIESFKNGINKIRLNTSPDIYTKEWGNDKIGKKLYTQYSKQSSNSFEQDF